MSVEKLVYNFVNEPDVGSNLCGGLRIVIGYPFARFTGTSIIEDQGDGSDRGIEDRAS